MTIEERVRQVEEAMALLFAAQADAVQDVIDATVAGVPYRLRVDKTEPSNPKLAMEIDWPPPANQ